MTRGQFVTLVLATVVVGVLSGQETRGAQLSLAGRQAVGATVPPMPTPPIAEDNTGIAAKYPGDVGIEKDPDVIFVESFEG